MTAGVGTDDNTGQGYEKPVSSPLPSWQPSVSLREKPPRDSSAHPLILMHLDTDGAHSWPLGCWVHSNNTCCMCLRPRDSLMRMYPQRANSRSQCQDAAAATRAGITASRLTHSGQRCQRWHSDSTVRTNPPQIHSRYMFGKFGVCSLR